MGTFFINEQGQRVGLCPECKEIKADVMFQKRRKGSNQFTRCYECNRKRGLVLSAEWAVMRHEILTRAGGCVWPGCHMKYPRDLPGNFALDHIDPSLKQHRRETKHSWVMHNQEEFWRRVFPNLQVLCHHHNNEKRCIEFGVGGVMHTDPWDEDVDKDLILDFTEIAMRLPGMESFVNPLT